SPPSLPPPSLPLPSLPSPSLSLLPSLDLHLTSTRWTPKTRPCSKKMAETKETTETKKTKESKKRLVKQVALNFHLVACSTTAKPSLSPAKPPLP
ncbi:hypothetical protein GBAR_LOCUS10016, partial [Geodia barretti]